jgi:glycosyltransferase involved in cell wall biosynthesis
VQREADANVLVLTNMWPEPTRAAYGIFVERQVHALKEAGVRCDVLYARGYLSKAVYVLGVPLMLWLSLATRRRYRAVHVHCGEMALIARFFLTRPMIATYHGDDVLGYRADEGPVPFGRRLRAAVIRYHACLYNATVTQSAEMHNCLPRRARRHDTIIPCGVDTTRFFPRDREEARQALGWDSSERIVLFAATRPYEPRKRFDLAQAAVKHAERELGPIRLAVAENQPPESIPLMMNAADCLLLTSMAEGSPVVVKESLMCNLPVIATDVADVKDMLADVSPSAVCSHNPAELGDALVTVLGTGGRSNGRKQRADLSQETTVARLLELYGRLGVAPSEVRATTPLTTQAAHTA